MVFVLAKNKHPLMPCSEKRARLLLQRGRARIHTLYPFTIRLIDRTTGVLQPIALKIDPGSKTTGIALLREQCEDANVLFLADLAHRGSAISKKIHERAGYRRRRRSANLRYRAPRLNNRTRKAGWLAPSLQHRIDSTFSWARKLQARAPITSLAQELVRFDTQVIQNAEISGTAYQRGTLYEYEAREYIFEKFGRQCSYCDTKTGPLNLDHVQPKSRGGSNRVANLVPACIPCNTSKGSQPIEQFLSHDPLRLARIRNQLKTPLKDAAAVNATRWALFQALSSLALPLQAGTGGQTKFNRKRYDLPKTHTFDAVCVGMMDTVVTISNSNRAILVITCMGRGSYQRTRVTANGFPRGYLMRGKRARGFATGDLVIASVPKGKHTGTHTGRVAVRATGSFNIQKSNDVLQGISVRHVRLLQRNDGYRYCLSPSSERTPLLLGLNAEVSAA